MPLHITKVAFGCASLDYLRERIDARTQAGAVEITTRYRPTRHPELAGGSLFWIIKHQLVARQPILEFVEIDHEKRWTIRLGAPLVPVRPLPKRAHQGWRYLTAENTPPDFADGDAEVASMPSAMLNELATLALI